MFELVRARTRLAQPAGTPAKWGDRRRERAVALGLDAVPGQAGAACTSCATFRRRSACACSSSPLHLDLASSTSDILITRGNLLHALDRLGFALLCADADGA